jgi:hypothetical protein
MYCVLVSAFLFDSLNEISHVRPQSHQINAGVIHDIVTWRLDAGIVEPVGDVHY